MCGEREIEGERERLISIAHVYRWNLKKKKKRAQILLKLFGPNFSKMAQYKLFGLDDSAFGPDLAQYKQAPLRLQTVQTKRTVGFIQHNNTVMKRKVHKP